MPRPRLGKSVLFLWYEADYAVARGFWLLPLPVFIWLGLHDETGTNHALPR